jgi:hypothetical protein
MSVLGRSGRGRRPVAGSRLFFFFVSCVLRCCESCIGVYAGNKGKALASIMR